MIYSDALCSRPWVWRSAVGLLIIIGIGRIVAAHAESWQTFDEPYHLAAGMEWLDRGQFRYEIRHPPLARVAGAMGPYFGGVRSFGMEDMLDEGNRLLAANGAYERNLSLARLGIVPFFVAVCLVVAFWGQATFGQSAGLAAVLLLTTTPPFLGHAGFATLDMPCAAMTTMALFAWCLWLEEPSRPRSWFLGCAAALAVLAKFTAVGFLAISGLMLAVLYWFRTSDVSRGADLPSPRRRLIKMLAWAAMAFFLTIWAGYRFSFGPIKTEGQDPLDLHGKIQRWFASEGIAHDAAVWLTDNLLLPAPDFWRGAVGAIARNNQGQTTYFLGEVRSHGWWYYYPLIIAMKTPLPFLILTVIGVGVALGRIISRAGDLRLLGPLIAVFGIVGLGMIGSIHNGVRQVLPVYPLLALTAGFGVVWLFSWTRFQIVGAGLGVVLLSWQLAASVLAHSDYLSYFNELVGDSPERIVVDSDLDWGQDLKRLATALERRGVTRVAICYLGTADLELPFFHLPNHTGLAPHTKTTGWIAISVYQLKLGDYAWLDEYEPVEKVGRSIRLYYIEK